MDDQLIEEYSKAITIIEIEHESHALQSPGIQQASQELLDRMAILESLRTEYDDLKRQLEASEEIEKFLK